MKGIFGASARGGFTLIEMSVVLATIGLLIGGVLVGQNLISSAGMRGTISQLDKYTGAVNTFDNKYGGLPGDIPASLVARFGFTAVPSRSGSGGNGDGNGLLEGCLQYTTAPWVESCEPLWFWEDLSVNSGLIDGGFSSATNTWIGGSTTVTTSQLPLYLPEAKLRGGNYIYVYSFNKVNYFGIAALDSIDTWSQIHVPLYSWGWGGGLTPAQASALDSKIDDGLPKTGTVQAFAAPSGGNNYLTQSVNHPAPGLTNVSCFLTDTNQYAVLVQPGVLHALVSVSSVTGFS